MNEITALFWSFNARCCNCGRGLRAEDAVRSENDFGAVTFCAACDARQHATPNRTETP